MKERMNNQHEEKLNDEEKTHLKSSGSSL